MINAFIWVPAATAVAGLVLGASLYRSWEKAAARNKKRIPEQWQLQGRPLFTDVEHTVWHWLKSAFFDHYVLVKIPVIRFLSPLSVSAGQDSHELLKGVYCSFAVCAADGTVIGCIDVPGSSGLKASKRDMKQKLFAECGIAYAVVSAAALPTREVLRDAFLGEFEIPDEPDSTRVHPYAQAGNAGDPDAESPETVPDGLHTLDGREVEMPAAIDMLAIAAARNNLKSKLEQGRKTRLSNMDSLSASLGIVDDHADHGIEVQWDDSFIMGEDEGHGEAKSEKR